MTTSQATNSAQCPNSNPNPNSNSRKRGWQSEYFVQTQLCLEGWSSLYHDVKIGRVQVDLIMRDRAGLLTLLEVKTQSVRGLAHLSHSQKRRLSSVCASLAEYEAVQMLLVLVESEALRVLPVDRLTAG